MNIGNILLLLEFFLLLFFAAFFSSAETAITAISDSEYRTYKKSRKKRDRTITYLIEQKEKIVSSTLIMTNFLHMLLSSIVTVFTLEVLGSFYIPHATACTTVLIIIFAEIIPKTLATHFSLSIIKKTAPILFLLYVLSYPLVLIFSYLSRSIVFCLKFVQKEKDEKMSERELKKLIDISMKDGAILSAEYTLLKKAVHLKSIKIKSLMTKRSKIIYVLENDSQERVIETFKMSNFSRLPVLNAEGSAFLGLIHYKDVLFNLNTPPPTIKHIMKSPIFVPESSNVFSIIKLMNSEKRNMVFVIDDEGDVLGLLTMDDILSLVCGKAEDEYSQNSDDETKSIKYIDKESIEVDPSISLEELNELIGTNFSSLYYESLSGLILERCQHLPKEKELIELDGIKIEIVKVKNAKIERVLVYKNNKK